MKALDTVSHRHTWDVNAPVMGEPKPSLARRCPFAGVGLGQSEQDPGLLWLLSRRVRALPKGWKCSAKRQLSPIPRMGGALLSKVVCFCRGCFVSFHHKQADTGKGSWWEQSAAGGALPANLCFAKLLSSRDTAGTNCLLPALLPCHREGSWRGTVGSELMRGF